MSGGLPARVRAMTNTEPENKEPQNRKKPITNEKQSPQQTGYATNKIKRGSGKFVVLRQKSLNASSCSSEDASSESSESHSLASSSSSWSTGRMAVAARRNAVVGRRKQCSGDGDGKSEEIGVEGDDNTSKKRCAWVTPTTDPCHATFHDEEWGVPVHDDKKLFELLSLSGALAELSWPAILNKRHIFREVFLDFDPIAVSKLNERRIGFPGSPASSLLSELKLRSIIENARQILKVIEEFGSFDKYIWNFVNHKPIISQFRYSRQVPVKTPKAELISKDLVKRGFRSVSPTVIYSFMQIAGLTNDHLISCFRFQDCTIREEAMVNVDNLEAKTK